MSQELLDAIAHAAQACGIPYDDLVASIIADMRQAARPVPSVPWKPAAVEFMRSHPEVIPSVSYSLADMGALPSETPQLIDRARVRKARTQLESAK